MKVLLENLVRLENGRTVTVDDIKAVARVARRAQIRPRDRVPPGARADAGFHRRAGGGRSRGDAPGDGEAGRRPEAHQPAVAGRSRDRPFGDGRRVRQRRRLCHATSSLEFERNDERYAFLRWGQGAFDNFRVVPPGTGICHQVNLEYLAQVVWTHRGRRHAPSPIPTRWSAPTATPPWSTASPCSAGASAASRPRRRCWASRFRCCCRRWSASASTASCAEGATATDLVLTVTQMLRKKGVVGKFVEFFGPGLAALALADRATIANMAPEYGATCGFFPIDAETLNYLKFTGRDAGASQAGRGLCQGARHVARRDHARSRLHRHAVARSRQRRAVDGRAAPAAGPRGAGRYRQGLHRRGAEARRQPRQRQDRRPGAGARHQLHA